MRIVRVTVYEIVAYTVVVSYAVTSAVDVENAVLVMVSHSAAAAPMQEQTVLAKEGEAL